MPPLPAPPPNPNVSDEEGEAASGYHETFQHPNAPPLESVEEAHHTCGVAGGVRAERALVARAAEGAKPRRDVPDPSKLRAASGAMVRTEGPC